MTEYTQKITTSKLNDETVKKEIIVGKGLNTDQWLRSLIRIFYVKSTFSTASENEHDVHETQTGKRM